jgi:hypothetical protein
MTNYTWSYSSISLFQQCPRKYYRLRVSKDIVEPPSPHLDYGKEVHKAAEDYISIGKPIPEKYAFIKPHLDQLIEIPGYKYCEHQMGLTAEFEPCGFFDKEVWFRGVADLLIINGKNARVIDYKTGKSSQYADVKQLELLALLVFKHFPEVERVKGGLVFLVAKDFVRADFDAYGQQVTWQKWIPEIHRLEQSYQNEVWNAKPNFTCRKHCPVTDCEHNGKGEYR